MIALRSTAALMSTTHLRWIKQAMHRVGNTATRPYLVSLCLVCICMRVNACTMRFEG